jgi:hypothetical protein
MAQKGVREHLEPIARQMYVEGQSLTDIAAELKISRTTLTEWKARSKAPLQPLDEWDQARSASRAECSAALEKVGARLRRSRELSATLTGDLKNQGNMGMLLNETIRSMMFDMCDQISTVGLEDPEAMSASIDQVKGLALTLQRAEAAASLNQKMTAEIRKQALDDVAKAVDRVADGGTAMTADDFKKILRDTYGA